MQNKISDRDFFADKLKRVQLAIEAKEWPPQFIEILIDVAQHNLAWLSDLKAASEEGGDLYKLSAEEDSSLSPHIMNLAKLRAILHQHKVRDLVFKMDFFGDPAWNMMLTLMQAYLEKTDVSVSTLRDASGVPATTALRWISRLTQAKLCKRVNDQNDHRRSFIVLTEKGRRLMTQFLSEWEHTANLPDIL